MTIRRRHHNLQQKGGGDNLQPDPFVKGRTMNRRFVQDVSKYNANFEDPRDWDNPSLDRAKTIRGNYEIQEIDEIWFTTKPRMTDYKYRIAQDDWLQWLGDTQEDVDQWNEMYGKDKNKKISVDDFTRAFGGRTFVAKGVWDWQTLYGGDQNHVWDVTYKNPKSPEDNEVVVEAPDEKTLVDKETGSNGNGYRGLSISSDNQPKQMQVPGVIKKLIITFITDGQIQVNLKHYDNSWTYGPFLNTKAGRQEYLLDMVYTKPVKAFTLTIRSGTIAMDKTKMQPEMGKVSYMPDGINTAKDYDWSFGLGIEVYNYQEYLKEPNGKWKCVDLPQLEQLMGQAPIVSNDIFTNIMHFIGGNAAEDDNIPFIMPYNNHQNTSGFGLYCTGAKGGGRNDRVHSFEHFAALHIGEWYDWDHNGKPPRVDHRRISFVPGLFDGRSKYIRIDNGHQHGLIQSAQARYYSVKTPEELGYKLLVDESNDQILMVKPNFESSLPELPTGIERGIALRYTNREHRKVLRKWSEIEVEAAEIRGLILEQ